MYYTSGSISIYSSYAGEVFSNALGNISSKTTPYEDIILLLPVMYKNTVFDAVEFQRRYRENSFALGNLYLTPLSQHLQ